MPEHGNKVICIDDWEPDESSYEKGLYPEGSREKVIYRSPGDASPTPLRARWRHLFKKSRARTPWQFWMEVMAYRIGRIMDVPVPPAYVAVSHVEKRGEAVYGALIEWFYSEEQGFTEGSRLIGRVIPDYDYQTGRQHNLRTILALPELLAGPGPVESRRNLLEYWAKVLAFDTVIGNVDRHADNWGLVTSREAPSVMPTSELSPAFDNGTAMSYEQPEENFCRFRSEAYLLKYLTRPKRARHHMRWALDDMADLSFFDFMRRFVSAYPETKPAIMGRLTFTAGDLHAAIDPLTATVADERWRLTPARLDFTLALILKRVSLLRQALETV